MTETQPAAVSQFAQSNEKSSARRPASRSRKILDAGNTQKSQMMLGATQGKTGDADAAKSLLTTKKKAAKPAYLQSLNESEKQANFKIIDSMNKKISYLKNPRFRVSKAPITMVAAAKDTGEVKLAQGKTSFRVEPTQVAFSNYQVNGVYEILVKVTNMAHSAKRIKFVPPQTDVFTLSRVKYPDGNTGDIATGMSVTMAVIFQAPSFADFDDNVVFVTEEGSFKLPLTARRQSPVVNLVNPMNCLNSWLGDKVDMAFRCVNSGGDGGFKFFCERDEDDSKQTDAESIRIGSFTLTPSEFYLYSGNAIDVYISFTPQQEGQLNENLILACDNQTSEFYKVTGYGAMLDLEIIAVDGKPVDFTVNPFETIFFENTNPTATSKRRITVKNASPITVPFHWSIYKEKNATKISLEDETTHYSVTPQSGKLLGNECIEFEVCFSPDHAEPYFEFADLIVEDVPISAIRNPPEGLKHFAAQAQAQIKNSKVPMPTYVGSNTQFLSIPMISFNLRGQGNSCRVEVQPPITFFDGDTFIDHEYRKKIELRKPTEGIVKYKLRLEGQNRDFDIDIIANGMSLSHQSNGVIEGQISTDYIDLEYKIRSKTVGPAMAYFYIEIEDGPPVSFQVQADFMGPNLSLSEACLDVGLSKVNTIQNQKVILTNESPIPAQFIVKSSKNKRLTFELSNNEIGADSTASFSVGKPFITKKGNNIEMNTYRAVLKPYQQFALDVKVNCITEETIDEHIEVMVQDGKSLYLQVLGEVQKPKVYLNRQEIDLGHIYAGVREVVECDLGKHKTQAIELVNYGNLPAHFRWEDKDEKGRIQSHFEPSEGTIPPKSKVRITFQVTVFIGGQIDELFMCDVEDLELPLGFEMKADAFGLNVAYLTAEEPSDKSTEVSDTDSMVNGLYPLKALNFMDCRINRPLTKKFILKNLSGIATKFNFSATEFEPLSHKAPQQKSEVTAALEAEAERQKKEAADNAASQGTISKKRTIRFAENSKSSPGMSLTSQMKRGKPILTDEHEAIQKFSSASGGTFTQTKVMDKNQNFFLSNNKGIALVFTPNDGDLPPNAEVPITVTIYNNLCGKFDDKVQSIISGLPPMEFPVRIGISGSPVIIPPNQVGLNYSAAHPMLPIPTTVHNSAPVAKTFKIKNTGIRALQVDWKTFDSEDLRTSDNDLFKIGVVKNTAFDKRNLPFKFSFTAIEPAETVDSAFVIEPKSTVVNCRSTMEFKVTFSPSHGLGDFKSILVANPQLAQEEIEIIDDPSELPKAGSLGIIAVNVQAQTIAPCLKIDKSLKMDNERHINFKVWSTVDEYAPAHTRKLIFSNDSKADMIFNLNTTGPFEIVGTKTNTGAKHPLAGQNTPTKVMKKKVETMFCLQPQKIVDISVKFKAPKANNNDEWPMVINTPRQGILTANFANGETQKFFLEGEMLRPMVNLLTEAPSKNDYAVDEMNFGVCNVDKTRTIRLYLSNETPVTAKWALNYVKFPKKTVASKYTTTKWEEENANKNDDPDVFEFSISNGSLRGKSLPLRKIPEGLCVPPVAKDEEESKFLPQTILVNFRPKQNVLYKSKFRFTVENGLSVDVILKGKGSYEEQHD